MAWRQTEEELIAGCIVRALRRDPIANNSKGWRRYVQELANRIEQSKIKITVAEKK